MPFKNKERIFPRDYENRTFCEDCLTFMRGIPGGSVPLILTDPLYDIHYSNQFTENPHTMLPGDDGTDYPAFTGENYRILRMDSHAYFFARLDYYPHHFQCLQEAGLTIKNCLVIEKGILGGIGGLKGSYVSSAEWVIFCQRRRRAFNSIILLESQDEESTMFHKECQPSKWYKIRSSDCWFGSEHPRVTHHSMRQKENGIFHPTAKSEICLQWLIQILNSPDDLVFNGFMGTGSTVLAAIQSGRKSIGTEVSEEYRKITQDWIREAREGMVSDEEQKYTSAV